MGCQAKARLHTNMVKFRRKNIRLPRTAYIGQQWYFLTTCTQERAPFLSDRGHIQELLTSLKDGAAAQRFAIQAYCFMPNHLHLLASGESDTSDCMAFINLFKPTSGFVFKQRTGQRLWQHKSYDHILRPGDSWQAVAWYIWMNPVRQSLCPRPEDWPYSGSETVDWRRLLTPPEQLWTPPRKKRAM
ncbi:MAG: transposase [Acidobacteria bacterium]|nr:transposase [Acidobacteriota bacterium]